MKNGNSFITVQSAAGGSYNPSLGDEGYRAYVFGTDKGTLEISVAEGTSNEPHFSTDQILAKVIKLNECLIKTKGILGTPLFQNNTVRSVDPNLNFIKVNKVYPVK
jgi:hypothetical protein